MPPEDRETVAIDDLIRQVLEAAQDDVPDSNDAAPDELYVDPRD